jgi:hypothetical protein
MSPIQTDYPSTMRKGLPGLIQGSDYNSRTGIVETEAGIGFGLPVSQGASEKGVVLGGALADFAGITIRDVAIGAEAGAAGDKYPNTKNAGILTRGKIQVVAGANGIVAGDPVHYNATTGVWLKTGQQGPIPHARYASNGDQGDIVEVELTTANV